MKFLLTLSLLGFSVAAQAERVAFPTGDALFTADQAVKGVVATENECAQVAAAVWARTASGQAECIRYWPAGLQTGDNKAVLFYMPGDQLVGTGVDPSYTRRGPREMQQLANQMQARAGVPFILLSRPGIFGSSGNHRERRREPESRIVSAALDAIKARHGIAELAITGQSGGGHIVSALVGWRADVACAVPTSAVSSPRARWESKGQKRDFTGFSDSYEPVEQLKAGGFHPKLRVFVLGDPRDSNTPWETQLPFARKLKTLGVEAEVVEGEGAGGERHMLGNSGQLLGALCLKGAPTQEILDAAAKGLKG